MAEFYMTLEDSADAVKIVHKDNCATKPPENVMRYLGSFASGQAALSKASNMYSQVEACPDCLPA